MKISFLTFYFILFSPLISPLYGQELSLIKKMESRVNYAENLIEQRLSEPEEIEKEIAALEQEIVEIVGDLGEFDLQRENRKQKIGSLLESLEQERKRTPWLKRTLGEENKIYKCYLRKIHDGLKVDPCGTLDDLPAQVTSSLEAYRKFWRHDEAGAKFRKQRLRSRLDVRLSIKKKKEADFEQSFSRIERAKNHLAQAKKDLRHSFASQASNSSCGPHIPTIDLEKDGVFKSLGRDHQDGVGTCYANTAKNLLYAATDGEANASFLDMALTYSGENPNTVQGGDPCDAILAVKKRGYCDKVNSPIETGAAPTSIALSGKSGEIYDHGYTIKKLETFLKRKDALDGKGEDLHTRAGKAVKMLLQDPYIQLPRPQLGSKIFNRGQMYLYYANIPAPKFGTSHDELVSDMAQLERNLDIAFAAQLKATGDVSIQDVFRELIDPFLKKYHVEDGDREKIINQAEISRLKNADKAELVKTVDHTSKFYSVLEGKEDALKTETLSGAMCGQKKDLFEFGKAMQSLQAHARELQIPLENMLDEEKLKSNKELLQLALAPNCLNPANRKKVPQGVQCFASSFPGAEKEYSMDKASFIRLKVLENLKQGLPVGNSYEAPPNNHINTIVGIRFDRATGKCQFKVRESMTATSTWEDEGPISRKMFQLTEVSK